MSEVIDMVFGYVFIFFVIAIIIAAIKKGISGNKLSKSLENLNNAIDNYNQKKQIAVESVAQLQVQIDEYQEKYGTKKDNVEKVDNTQLKKIDEVIEQTNKEIEIDDNAIYLEDVDLLKEIEKLPVKNEISDEHPFFRHFEKDFYYKTKGIFPQTEEELKKIGYFNISKKTILESFAWDKELNRYKFAFICDINIGKYTLRVEFDTARQRIYPKYAHDNETTTPKTYTYYFEELEEKIDEICSLGEEKIGANGLKYYDFNDCMSPKIHFSFKEYWNEPQTRKDFQKLGCTSIEYDGRDRDFRTWTCYKQIGNKVLYLYFPKFNRVCCSYAIWSISEIPQQTNEENKIKEQKKTTKPSSVYLLFNPLNNTYKIGKANDVYKRLRTFQTGTPDIQLVTYKTYASEKDAFRVENMLHRQYEDSNYKKEWFNLNEEDIEFIKQILS